MRPVDRRPPDAQEETPPSPNLRDPHQDVPEGESLVQFQQRIVLAIEDLAHAYAGQRVALFAHGGVSAVVWRQTTGLDLYAPRPGPIQNTTLNHFHITILDGQRAPLEW